MEIISHRGNLDGPDPARENTIEAITGAMALGYSVEFDVRYHDGEFWLGHDTPQRKLDVTSLPELTATYKGTLYVHCKTIYTLQRFIDLVELQHSFDWWKIVPFFHDIDECILLTNGSIWVHPHAVREALDHPQNSLFVIPDCVGLDDLEDSIAGVCTDFPNKLKANLK